MAQHRVDVRRKGKDQLSNGIASKGMASQRRRYSSELQSVDSTESFYKRSMTMNFTLTINGDTPAELLAALQQLNTPPLQPPQSVPVQQPDKPKTQTPAKSKKPTREPTAAPAEESASPTTAEASGSPSQADAAPAASTSAPTPDPAMLDKIRDLARSLIVAGKRAGVQAAIKATGAASISKLPPDSYTSVWEELLKLKDEVDANASN